MDYSEAKRAAGLIALIEDKLPKWQSWFPDELSMVQVPRCDLLSLVACAKAYLDGSQEILTRLERLTAEAAELHEMTLRSDGVQIHDGHRAGWWDSCANSDVMHAGDRLVEMGLWERDPNGHGRRQFYRPKQQAVGG